MAWLARLDARSRRWPRVLRWCYLVVKWYLIVGGCIGAGGLALEEIHERRVGLGTGIVTACLFALIKGTLDAFRLLRSDSGRSNS